MALTIARWVSLAISIILVLGLILVLAGIIITPLFGQREMKDYESELNNGLYREVTITAEDGREIFHYEGKIDIETSHEGNTNYILFESEEGQRYIIYYGIQDTVLIVEKNLEFIEKMP